MGEHRSMRRCNHHQGAIITDHSSYEEEEDAPTIPLRTHLDPAAAAPLLLQLLILILILHYY
jgi:hypothetical protein